MPGQADVTALLDRWSGGDRAALQELMPMVYDELRRLARRQFLQERPDHTLQTTALVHEAYLRLVNKNVQWQSRAHFFALAAQMMRRVLVDHARRRHAAKRGAGAVQTPLGNALEVPVKPDMDVLALDQSLDKLATFDPQKAKVVELRFFGGLSVKDVSEVLEVSSATVKRDWTAARAWLYRDLRGEAPPHSE